MKTSSSVSTPTTAFDAADYAALEQGIQSRLGIRLSDYRREQMQRRLQTLAQAQGHASFAAFLQCLAAHPSTQQTFLETMTINVTQLFRNPERFEDLRALFLPEMLRRRGNTFSAWSAGCSYGAEAYTLAMLLHELEPGGKHQIVGTDIDRTVLAKAEAICFNDQDMTEVSSERRQMHFQDLGGDKRETSPLTPRYRPRLHLSAKIRFQYHDLLASSYPANEHDLILCRNVLIYFTEDAKERIFRGFQQALRPGGILFVGGTERISDHRAAGFDLIRPFFYRKPPAS